MLVYVVTRSPRVSRTLATSCEGRRNSRARELLQRILEPAESVGRNGVTRKAEDPVLRGSELSCTRVEAILNCKECNVPEN
jgi:hypothetical protein